MKWFGSRHSCECQSGFAAIGIPEYLTAVLLITPSVRGLQGRSMFTMPIPSGCRALLSRTLTASSIPLPTAVRLFAGWRLGVACRWVKYRTTYI